MVDPSRDTFCNSWLFGEDPKFVCEPVFMVNRYLILDTFITWKQNRIMICFKAGENVLFGIERILLASPY